MRYLRLGSEYVRNTFVAAISSREIDTSGKKKKSISVPVGCQSLDEQVILPSNFHRDSFDRTIPLFPPPYLLFIYLLNSYVFISFLNIEYDFSRCI